MIVASKRTDENLPMNDWRESIQPLLPRMAVVPDNHAYNPIPFHTLGNSKIGNGFNPLAEWIISQNQVLIDGYIGVFFNDIQQQLQTTLESMGFSVAWHYTSAFLKPEAEIDEITKPFLGGRDEVWGTKTNLDLKDFFDIKGLSAITQDSSKNINIVIGIGAALVNWDAPVVFIDVPKNEIQYRMRARSITNLGKKLTESAFNMYKRLYFVDWVVLNNHKSAIIDRISVIADGQRAGEICWMLQEDFNMALSTISHTAFRARPWFEKGSWGGQWMKNNLNCLNNEEVNYAWSFELITPENGIVFESDGHLLEVSFDFLMLKANHAVLGKHAEIFGAYFPIRFDFLDTFNGGNLSIQCHPSKTYIREMFGENITQDETYYILDCEPDAKVYLGFQEDINKEDFKAVLEKSEREHTPIQVEKYVRSFSSQKHDLFLIPNGTVHSSGVNNMVLEISATPYIFTFKMYDWLSMDLDGNTRPINIDHAFNNLNFERKGKTVEQELIAKPKTIKVGTDWRVVHLATHIAHFYDVHRIEFATNTLVNTENSCHVLMLVEGKSISVKINGKVQRFNYAETFIIPAAVGQYRLINEGPTPAKVIKAFLKDNITL